MKPFWARLLPGALTLLFAASLGSAGTLQGTVVNRTTGQPVPNADVDLLSPTQGMALLGSAKSDAQGNFTASNSSIGMAPVLIRVTYQGVSFNTFSPPGRPHADVEVFDVTKDPKTITADSHVIIFQPRGDKLLGAEEYVVKNNSKPPAAYFRSEGNFEFGIPDKGALQQVSTVSELGMGMEVPQASIDKGKDVYAIAYAFRPGETKVHLSYNLPYPSNTATFRLPATYPGVRLLLVAPPGVTVTGDGVRPAGQEQGMNVFLHDALAAKGSLTVSLSGVGSAPVDSSGDQQSAAAQEGNSRAQGPQVDVAPPRIDDLKWPLLGGLLALFAVGAVLLSRKQVVVPAGPGNESQAASAPAPQKATKGKDPLPSVEAVKESVNASLDSLKEDVFRLELRKQAGTISDEEYAREKSRVEKLLRNLVRG